MRLLLLGPLEGYISIAGKIALARGAKVTHVDDIERGLAALRSGNGAELVMMDVKLDIARFVTYASVKGAKAPAEIGARMLREFVYHLKDLGLSPDAVRLEVDSPPVSSTSVRQMLAQQNAWSQLKDQDKSKSATN